VETENQIVVEMIRLAALGGDAVNVDADERRGWKKDRTGFLHDFAAGDVRGGYILRFDMAAR
jgi:hypothetical protein